MIRMSLCTHRSHTHEHAYEWLSDVTRRERVVLYSHPSGFKQLAKLLRDTLLADSKRIREDAHFQCTGLGDLRVAREFTKGVDVHIPVYLLHAPCRNSVLNPV